MAPLLLFAQGSDPTAGDVCASSNAICEAVFNATGSEVVATAAGDVVPTLLRVLAILAIAWVVSRVAQALVRRFVGQAAEQGRDALSALKRRASVGNGHEELDEELAAVRADRVTQRATTIANVAASVTGFTVWTIAVIMVLASFGVNVGPLIAGAGIVGVALGFGAQSLVEDFLSGTFMLLEDQYGIGDVVNVGEATGVVEHVSLRVTRLRDVEGTVWHVPNGEIKRVGNMSQLWSRSLLDIGVAYDTDLDQASAVIQEVAHGMAIDPEWDPEILEEPEMWGVEQFGASEVVLRLVMKTKPASQWKVNREFRRRLKTAFDDAGIEIPFPQRTIWVKQDAVPGSPVPIGSGDPEE